MKLYKLYNNITINNRINVYYNILYNMDLAKRDMAIKNMMTELENRRQLLKGKYKELQNASTENELLKDVLEDYLLYYNSNKDEKIKQYEALNKTLEHIDNIVIDSTTNEEMLRNSKIDQKEIMNEMKRIKSEIDKLN